MSRSDIYRAIESYEDAIDSYRQQIYKRKKSRKNCTPFVENSVVCKAASAAGNP
jgi:hypothetical protein